MKTLKSIWSWSSYYVPASILFVISLIFLTLKIITQMASNFFKLLDRYCEMLVNLLKDKYYYRRKRLISKLLTDLLDISDNVLLPSQKIQIYKVVIYYINRYTTSKEFDLNDSLSSIVFSLFNEKNPKYTERQKNYIDILYSYFALKDSNLPIGLKISIEPKIKDFTAKENTSVFIQLEAAFHYLERHITNLPDCWTKKEACTLEDLLPKNLLNPMSLPDHVGYALKRAEYMYFGEEKGVDNDIDKKE